MVAQAYEFERFPRGKLPTHLTRRQFFQGLIHELRAFSRQEGHPMYRLTDLGDAPDKEIALVIPVQVAGSEIVQKDGFVWGIPPESENQFRLFPVESPALYVLGQFNGERSIVDVGRNLASSITCDKQWAFAFVRGVFLWLVLAKLFVPRGGVSRISSIRGSRNLFSKEDGNDR